MLGEGLDIVETSRRIDRKVVVETHPNFNFSIAVEQDLRRRKSAKMSELILSFLVESIKSFENLRKDLPDNTLWQGEDRVK